MNYLDELNESQRQAVEYMDGPCLVVAGAGSGKTRVLTYKIAYLLEHGYKPSEILALTFTNKAAREMRERIGRVVGAENARYLWMGTFHSIAAKILRQEAEQIGFTRDFSIYDTTDSKSLIRTVLKERALDEKIYKPASVLSCISDAKSKLLTPLQYRDDRDIEQRDRNARMGQMAEVYMDYQKRLRQSNAMDFDDLLMYLCLYLREHHDRLRFYQGVFKYVLVDEYQDTNYVQFMLVKMLAEPQNMVCVVGDDAQSIYSFRGADIRNILSFQRIYEDAKLFKLERNYRSTQTIVAAANSIIHKNLNQISKDVYSEKEKGEQIAIQSYATDRDEAEGVVREIRRLNRPLPGEKAYGLNCMAILYRTNAQSRVFENELRKYNVSYRIYGGTSFYQRKEVKDAIAYFRMIVNPKDWEALVRSINNPARGIGDVTVRRIREEGMDAIAHRNKAVAAFVEMLQEMEDAEQEMDAYDFAKFVLNRSGIMADAAKDITPEGIDRKQNLDELLTSIHEFVDMRKAEGVDFTPIADFLAEVSLLTDQDEHVDDKTPRVTLMTVHAAKGLEFPVVWVVGMEDNLFPSQFCMSGKELEEERRLLYVAVTRAMERCTLTHAGQRFRNGTVNLCNPSLFLKDIDPQFVKQTSNRVAHTGYQGAGGFVARPTETRRTSTEGLSRLKGTGDGTSKALHGSGFKPGDRVMHKVFGEGSVMRVYAENENEKIDVLFDRDGKKTLLLTYAKLTKVNRE